MKFFGKDKVPDVSKWTGSTVSANMDIDLSMIEADLEEDFTVEKDRIDEFLDGYRDGRYPRGKCDPNSREGWFFTESEALFWAPLVYDKLDFRMKRADRKINLLRYRVANVMIIAHHNIATAGKTEGYLYLKDGVSNSNFKSDNNGEIRFFIKPVALPRVNITEKPELLIKRFMNGFNKKNYEGWDINKARDEASIILPISGGFIDFTLKISSPKTNRLRCFRDDIAIVLYNVGGIKRARKWLTFYNGVVDYRMRGNNVNFMSFVIEEDKK
jgi:hypothetical protein